MQNFKEDDFKKYTFKMVPSSPNPGALAFEEEGKEVEAKSELKNNENETQLTRVVGGKDSSTKSEAVEKENGAKVVTHASLEGELVEGELVEEDENSTLLTVSRV